MVVFLCLSIESFGQKASKYDSTLKIAKVGYKVNCMNRKPDVNVLSIKPIGFKNEGGEVQ